MEIGLYVRIQRGKKWVTVDITDMSEEELNDLFTLKREQGIDGWSWFKSLLTWIKDNVKTE